MQIKKEAQKISEKINGKEYELKNLAQKIKSLWFS